MTEASEKPTQSPEPDVRDEPYGPHEANKLDLWLAKGDKPAPLVIYFHGGGFYGGDKQDYRPNLLSNCLAAGMAFAAVNYRLSDVAPYPAQMHDSARAVQFLRVGADKWGLDPERFAATGGSAGAGISMWLGFHDDLAQPGSDDPLARQSTRLRCMAVYGAQCSYDPRDHAEIAGFPPNSTHPALEKFFRLPAGWTYETISNDKKLDALTRDSSPITHLTAGDPPVWAIYSRTAEVPGDVHHPNFGRVLKQRLDELGIECVLRLWEDYPGESDGDKEMAEFIAKHI